MAQSGSKSTAHAMTFRFGRGGTDEKSRNGRMTELAGKRAIIAGAARGIGAAIANVATFLANNQSSHIAGQTICADGGRQGLNYAVPASRSDL